jgi:hypothetical protein
MKLRIKTDNSRLLQSILLLIFVITILLEAYLLYSYVYKNLIIADEELPVGNVVRVNLKSYENTVSHLERLYQYQAPQLNLPISQPFAIPDLE